MVSIVPLLFVGLFGLLGLVAVLSGVGQLSSWNTLRNSQAGAVTGTGVTEVEGTARPLDETLTTPHWDAESVAFEFEREEYDHDVDEEGSNWETEESVTDSVPFVVESPDGDVVVEPSGANLLFEEQQEREGQYRYTENRLDVGEQVYAAGEAVRAEDVDVDTDGHKYVLTRTDTMVSGTLGSLFGSPFVLSDSGEDEAESRLLKSGIGSTLVGLFVLVFTSVIASVALF